MLNETDAIDRLILRGHTVRKVLVALAVGSAGGALFFAAMTLVASQLPTAENDPLIFGVAAALLSFFVAFSIMRRK